MVRVPDLIQEPDKATKLFETQRSEKPPVTGIDMRILRNVAAEGEAGKQIQKVGTQRVTTPPSGR